jgi:hypothetical protein
LLKHSKPKELILGNGFGKKDEMRKPSAACAKHKPFSERLFPSAFLSPKFRDPESLERRRERSLVTTFTSMDKNK